MDDWMEQDQNDLEESPRRSAKERKQNRRFRTFTTLALVLAWVLFLICVGLLIWIRRRDLETVADQVVYSLEEVDAMVEDALATEEVKTEEAVRLKEAELLDGIRESLEEGNSMVDTLRPYYPDWIVLVADGRYHFVPISDTLEHHSFKEEQLVVLEDGELQYQENGEVISHKGIDVSTFQGDIDWEKVAADGVEFAFIRTVFRGYGSGKLVEDETFEKNIEGAIGAGIKVGVYVFSQAINEAEIREEANLVLEKIAPYKITCPVVFDVEKIAGADGRMNHLTVEERTHLTGLFCETIESAGYQPMIYHNMEMAALMLDLEQLQDYDKWFAYYNSNFYYPYTYKVWQYSEKGKVDGISTEVDLDISFAPLWE